MQYIHKNRKWVRQGYLFSPEILDNWSLASDLSSDLTLKAQWGKNWLVTLKATKTKLVTFLLTSKYHIKVDT